MSGRLLYDNKITTLSLQGSTVEIQTNTAGKIKTSSKVYATEADALQQLMKKEWELLKKGAVLRSQDAKSGEPLLHLFTGSGYTGCLSFVATPQGIYVYRASGSGGTLGSQDELLRINHLGEILEVVTLPGVLPWEICYDADANQLLLDLDHYA
jgi:hypothetical protein